MAKASLHQLAQSKKPGGGQRPGGAQRGQPQGSTDQPYKGGPTQAGAGGPQGDPATMTPKQRRQAAHQAQAAAGRDIQSRMDPNDPRRYMNPRRIYKRSQGRNVDSPYPPAERMRNAWEERATLGFGEPQKELTSHYEEDLAAGAPVDY